MDEGGVQGCKMVDMVEDRRQDRDELQEGLMAYRGEGTYGIPHHWQAWQLNLHQRPHCLPLVVQQDHTAALYCVYLCPALASKH